MAADCLERPSEVPAEFDHHFSSLVPPSGRREIGESADAVGTQNSVEAKEELLSPLGRDHRNRLSLVRPMYHLD